MIDEFKKWLKKYDSTPNFFKSTNEHNAALVGWQTSELYWRKQERERIVGLIPTSWCDSLLTGKNAVIGEPLYSCQDIERLLLKLKKLIEKSDYQRY